MNIQTNEWLSAQFDFCSLGVDLKKNPANLLGIEAHFDLFSGMRKTNGVVDPFQGNLSIGIHFAVKFKCGQITVNILHVEQG